MKAHLLYRDRDIAWRAALEATQARVQASSGRRRERNAPPAPPPALPWNAEALVRDLNLETLFGGMAREDELIRTVARMVVLDAMGNDIATIRYRQEVLEDCLAHPDTVRKLYTIAAKADAKAQQHHTGTLLMRYPDWNVRHSISVLEALLDSIERIRKLADTHAEDFTAAGWKRFFDGIREQLSDERMHRIRRHLQELRFRDGVLMGAGLGPGNKGADYRLHTPPRKQGSRLMLFLRHHFPRLFDRAPPGSHGFAIDPRDESGVRALDAVKNRALVIAADSLSQAADHVRDFFAALQCELAFYTGCLNLYETLAKARHAHCVPTPHPPGPPHRLGARGLYDICLALSGRSPVVGNDLEADGKNLLVVTGANQGGKSTFLRSIGLAQLMMQAGMFVAAERFDSSLGDGLFTHFKREEDARLKSGKFEEELARMSDIIDRLSAHPIVLYNESFVATNEHEGSEIARQISDALLARRIRQIHVTHLHEFARTSYEKTERESILFLRAERLEDGSRSYKIKLGEPLETSFGEDLYARIFSAESTPRSNLADGTGQ